MRVLVAEDNLVNQAVAAGILQQAGHTITFAQNGLEAVHFATTERFDVILMDVQMPAMDGLTATGRIREWERTRARHIPIIAMTAHAGADDRERCLAAGMDDFVPKPISTGRLKQALDRVMRGTMVGASSPGAIPEPLPAPPTAPNSVSGIADELRQRLEGDEDLFQRVLGLFLENTPPHLATLETQLSAGDFPAVAATAHSLRGSLANVGATAAADLAREIEGMAQNQLLTPATLHEFRYQIDRVLAELGNDARRPVAV